VAVPKRKTSQTRQAKRRSQWKLKSPNLIACPQCHEYKLPHRVCPNCGFYKDRAVINQE
jgi:large subunit ribosomal protein L32